MAGTAPAPAPSLSPADFDASDPTAFYLLGPGRADMEALADATLVVEGRRLPVHSQFLSQQSGVLRGLFVSLNSSSQEGAGTRKRKAADTEEGLVLEAPFQECSLFEACLFLRFCYCHDDRTPANLAAVQDSLPGLLRLAHKLDAPQIQQVVCDCMAELTHTITMPQLLKIAAAADHCQLPELRLTCISGIACRLASGPSGLHGAVVDTSPLLDASGNSMLTSAALMELSGVLAEMLRRAANPGSFEWALERYSEQPAAVGDSVVSPWFTAAGKEWCFKVHPGGFNGEAAGHLSVFLCCSQPGTRAKFAVTLVDQAAEGLSLPPAKTKHEFVEDEMVWGWSKFVSHEHLRSRPGHLMGDRLVLRARVKLVQ